MRIAIAGTLCVALGLSACATSPDNVQATYVSPLQYQSFSCSQLSEEINRVGSRVMEVTGQQRNKASNDQVAMGVGLVLFWPALFFLARGSDKKDELGRLKGEYDALQGAALQKSCNTITGAVEPAAT